MMQEELGVKQITIPLPYRLNHVNCFMAQGSDGWTIIDAGLNSKESQETWNPIIQKHDVKDIIITHYHPDHFGYAGTLQQLTNASVWMTKIDAQIGLTFGEPEATALVRENYETCGLPDHFSKKLKTDDENFKASVKPYPLINHYLEEGQIVPFGKYEYEVIFTPGHSDGLITLFNKEKSILFSTDHILPRISPNISYWFHGNPNPLGAFFDSLKKIRLLDADYIIPSHGKPFNNANKRIDELLSHHEERLERVYEILKHPSSIFEVNNKLFSKLTIHESRFAIGETIAHLEYLYINQKCQKYYENGTWYYQAI